MDVSLGDLTFEHSVEDCICEFVFCHTQMHLGFHQFKTAFAENKKSPRNRNKQLGPVSFLVQASLK